MDSSSLRYRDIPASRSCRSTVRIPTCSVPFDDLEFVSMLAPDDLGSEDRSEGVTVTLAHDVVPGSAEPANRVCCGPVWDAVVDRLMLSFHDVSTRETIVAMVARAGDDLCCAATGALPELVERLVRQRLADVAAPVSTNPRPVLR